MRRLIVILLIGLLATLGLAGCGTKSAADVVEDLNDQLNELTSYQARANLQLHTGQTPQTYDVEVWYQKPHYYRISLHNAERKITQIILRNDEGVYVLTPELKKVFRFDSDWPENQRVFYLYESLVQSIVDDAERKFATDGDRYLFDVVADYPNRSLVRQKIWLRKDLAPDRVEVLDADGNVMVSVAFRDFRAGVTFDENAFDKERNLTGALLDSVPASTPAPAENLSAVIPTYEPEGVSLVDVAEIDGGQTVVLKYKGTYTYHLLEERPKAVQASFPYGTPIDLGFTVAVLSEGEKRTLRWTYGGVDYMLTGNLPLDEMVRVAMSTFGATGK